MRWNSAGVSETWGKGKAAVVIETNMVKALCTPSASRLGSTPRPWSSNSDRGSVNDFSLTIDGKAVESTDTFAVTNPASTAVVGHAPRCSPHLLDQAMHAAQGAFHDWRRDEAQWRAALCAAAELLSKATPELAALITAEQGKPLREAKFEIRLAQQILEYHSSVEIPRTVVQDDRQAFVEVVRRPLGVVAAITPWNFPVLSALGKIASALLVGNRSS